MAEFQRGSGVGSGSAPACLSGCCSAPGLYLAIGSSPVPYVMTRRRDPIKTGKGDFQVSEGNSVVNKPRHQGRLKVQLSAHGRGSIRGRLFLGLLLGFFPPSGSGKNHTGPTLRGPVAGLERRGRSLCADGKPWPMETWKRVLAAPGVPSATMPESWLIAMANNAKTTSTRPRPVGSVGRFRVHVWNSQSQMLTEHQRVQGQPLRHI